MEIKELLQEKQAEILKIAAQYGASNVRIFGSVARGEATADSDIDFLMDIQAGRSLLNRIALIQDLEDLLARVMWMLPSQKFYMNVFANRY